MVMAFMMGRGFFVGKSVVWRGLVMGVVFLRSEYETNDGIVEDDMMIYILSV